MVRRRRSSARMRVDRRPSTEYAVLLATLALGVALAAMAVGRHLRMLAG